VVSRQDTGTDIADTLQLREVAMATTLWLPSGYNFSCAVASDMLFNTIGCFRGQTIRRRHSRDQESKGRCRGNRFWDYVSCKWPLTGDNDIEISCQGWLDYSQPLRLLVALCFRSCGGDRNCCRRRLSG